MSARLFIAWMLSAALVMGCGSSSDVSSSPDASTQKDTTTDANVTSDADVAQDVPAEPSIVLGINEVLEKHPSAFTPLEEGDALEIELGGFNGLWMIVLAFKTRGYFPGRVIVFADVTVDGEELSSLALSKQDLEPGGDGWDYYYDLFLIVNDTSVGGKEATVDLTIRDYENKDDEDVLEVSTQKKVLIVGGDPPYWP